VSATPVLLLAVREKKRVMPVAMRSDLDVSRHRIHQLITSFIFRLLHLISLIDYSPGVREPKYCKTAQYQNYYKIQHGHTVATLSDQYKKTLNFMQIYFNQYK
jgi:alpha-D-ribose 1-methylphosphonate 5-triphosphate diphosphatase PhnM